MRLWHKALIPYLPKQQLLGQWRELKKSKEELRNAQMKYRQYSKSNGIDVDYELTWQNGYNK